MKEIKIPQIARAVQFLSRYRYVLLMMVVGILLLILPSGAEDTEVSQPTKPAPSATEELEKLEDRLAQMLSQVEGAGETQVLLTLEDGGERILAENTERDTAALSSETVLVTDGSRGEGVVELRILAPNFRGALVISQGAGNAAVQLELISAVSVLTGLPSNKIAICTAP